MGSEGKYLSPRVLQGVGVILLVAAGVYWAVSGQQSALIISAAMGLIGLGSYAGINISVRQEIREHQNESQERQPVEKVPNLAQTPIHPTYPGQAEPFMPGNPQLDEEDDSGRGSQ